MTHPVQRLAAAALLGVVLAQPCVADSFASSAASGSIGVSLGSISGSVQNSSNASSKGTNVAEGDYRIVDVATYDERPGAVRLKLQALADSTEEGAFYLVLPPQALEQGRLAQGLTVQVRHRPYGLEFTSGPTQQAFFLALSDGWYRDIVSQPVAL